MRLICLLSLLLLFCGFVIGQQSPDNDRLGPVRNPALLCNDCGFGSRKDNCVKCGKWVGSAKIPARLCSNCSFGSRKTNCVKCGKWVGNYGVPAKLCSNCGFGSKAGDCVKCGKPTFDAPASCNGE